MEIEEMVDEKKIYKYLLPSIKEIKKKYNYIPEKIIDEYVSLEIIEIKTNKNYNFNAFTSYVETNIRNYIINSIVESTKILDNFIISNKNINKISKFFMAINYIPEPELYIKLLKNSEIVNSIIKEEVIKNKDAIKNGKLYNLYNSDISTSLVETYCMLNNIEVGEEEITEDNYKIDDDLAIYLKEIGNIPLFSVEEEKKYTKMYVESHDSEIRNKIINSNLRLVVSIAKRYVGRGLGILDLIQEGNLGLMKAVDNFDPQKGCKFSTYATWWIRQSITRGIADTGRTVRIPVHMDEKVRKLKQEKERMEEELGREPTEVELAKKMRISINTVKECLRNLNDAVSLNVKISDDGPDELIEFIEDENNDGPANHIINDTLKVELMNHIKKVLTPKELEIIMYRKGFYDGTVWTLESVGQIYNVTRERIRQIEKKALTKLFNNRETKYFLAYLKDGDVEANMKKLRNNRSIEKSNTEKKDKEVISNKKCNIYETFKDYSKEEINYAINLLTENEKEELYDRYGGDLENPKIIKNVSNSYNRLRAKLARTLEKLYILRKDPIEVFAEENRKKITKISRKIEENDNNLNESKELTKEDCVKILEIIKDKKYENLTVGLSEKEQLISALKLGYIDGKCFSTDTISEVIGIDKEEIYKISAKAIILHQEKLLNTPANIKCYIKNK